MLLYIVRLCLKLSEAQEGACWRATKSSGEIVPQGLGVFPWTCSGALFYPFKVAQKPCGLMRL